MEKKTNQSTSLLSYLATLLFNYLATQQLPINYIKLCLFVLLIIFVLSLFIFVSALSPSLVLKSSITSWQCDEVSLIFWVYFEEKFRFGSYQFTFSAGDRIHNYSHLELCISHLVDNL